MDTRYLDRMRAEVEEFHLTQVARVTRTTVTTTDGRDHHTEALVYAGRGAVKRVGSSGDTFSFRMPLGKAPLLPNDLVRMDGGAYPVYVVESVAPVTPNATLAKALVSYRKEPPRV